MAGPFVPDPIIMLASPGRITYTFLLTYWSCGLQILLQNRLDFYTALIPRIPDPSMRERISRIASHRGDSVPIPTLTYDNKLLKELALLDPLCKPEFGRKWGRTTLSLDEALTRAIRFEELIILSGLELTANPPLEGLKELVDLARERLGLLIILSDDLRYHRIRLVEMP